MTLCDLMDYSPPGSSVYGISQARILEWVAISFSRGSSGSRDQATSPALAGGFFTVAPPRKSGQILTQLGQSVQAVQSQLKIEPNEIPFLDNPIKKNKEWRQNSYTSSQKHH